MNEIRWPLEFRCAALLQAGRRDEFPGFDITSWFGLVAPAGTPAAIIEMLHRETTQALASPEVRARLVSLGMVPIGNSSAEFGAVIRSETFREDA
jgi:tripartite-type tricarboxylate transporter receptor subunit TctC